MVLLLLLTSHSKGEQSTLHLYLYLPLLAEQLISLGTPDLCSNWK